MFWSHPGDNELAVQINENCHDNKFKTIGEYIYQYISVYIYINIYQ